MNIWREKNLSETELFKVNLLSRFKDNWEVSGLIYLKGKYNKTIATWGMWWGTFSWVHDEAQYYSMKKIPDF